MWLFIKKYDKQRLRSINFHEYHNLAKESASKNVLDLIKEAGFDAYDLTMADVDEFFVSDTFECDGFLEKTPEALRLSNLIKMNEIGKYLKKNLLKNAIKNN